MGLCDGARDFQPCIVQIEDSLEKKLCKKWSDTCARLRGSKGTGRMSRSPVATVTIYRFYGPRDKRLG